MYNNNLYININLYVNVKYVLNLPKKLSVPLFVILYSIDWNQILLWQLRLLPKPK